jgi:Protein of unknown function (DUF3592)
MIDPAKFLSRLGKFALIPIGVLLLLGAAWTISSTRTWVAHAVEVQGKVIEMVRIRDRDDGGYMFAPLVRFQTTDGRNIEFESSLRSNPPGYRTGQTVSVLYDPVEPQSAAIRGVFSLWLIPMVLGFMGSIFTAVGIAMVVLSGRAARFFDQTLRDAASPSSARAAAAPGGPSSDRAAAR